MIQSCLWSNNLKILSINFSLLEILTSPRLEIIPGITWQNFIKIKNGIFNIFFSLETMRISFGKITVLWETNSLIDYSLMYQGGLLLTRLETMSNNSILVSSTKNLICIISKKPKIYSIHMILALFTLFPLIFKFSKKIVNKKDKQFFNGLKLIWFRLIKIEIQFLG